MIDTPRIRIEALTAQIRALGVEPGAVLLVHTSFSHVGPVEGGPQGLIGALRAAIGAVGTLVMPSMSYDDDHAFDARMTPCPEMGVVADTFWRMPDVLRSDSPHAFAALGPLATHITRAHPLDVPHGLDSPVGRVYELNGQILLLGTGHGSSTTIHLAEAIAGVRYRRPKFVTITDGDPPVRFSYDEIDHCCDKFELVDQWLEEKGLQRRGRVGHGMARLVRARDVVDVVSARLRTDETVFLHEPGVDIECDEARASIARFSQPLE
jgi:aminoglycoside N3'-acetyltransferase